MPLASERPYTYVPLAGPLDIRFVILYPSTFSSPIEINILQTSLARKRPYEALSYTWGDQKTLRPISIYGQKRRVVYVTQNLEAALRHLRPAKEPRLLWIDALCINQADVNERSFQVMRMGGIFSRAKNVCIWLGEAADRSDEAMQFIDQVAHLGKLDTLVKDQGTKENWKALATLMKWAWFSRRWVIQEVAFARRATVYCGIKQSKWSDFSDAVTLFGDKFNEINLLFAPWSSQFDATGNKLSLGNVKMSPAYIVITRLNYIIRKASDGRFIQRLCTMETLISSLALLQTTDPRDTVYAIMTLAKDVILPIKSPVNYNLPLRQIFKDLIYHTVNAYGSLDIICRPWAPVSDDLPSWIPQISRHPFASGSDGRRINAESLVGAPTRPIYNVAGRMPPARAQFNDNNKGFIMSVKGFQLDIVRSIEQPACDGKIPGSWMLAAMRVAEENDEMQLSADYTSLSRIENTFWRILVADRGDDGNPPPGWYRRACEEAYRRCDFGQYDYGDLDTVHILDDPLDDGNLSTVSAFLRRVQAVTWNRRLVVTDESSVGIAPAETEEGDLVCIFFGCSVPVVLRENDDDTVRFIGECYINGPGGVMDGSSADSARHGKYEILDYKLK